jgi:hypothetical protein
LITRYKYLSAKSARRCLTDGTLYLAAPDQLNDALEARFDTADTERYRAAVTRTINEVARQRGGPRQTSSPDAFVHFTALNQREDDRFQAFCHQVGICSLATRPDDQAMWAYYADEGAGLCLEVTLTPAIMAAHQLVLEPVIYQSTPRVINRAEDWRATFLELAARYPDASIEALQGKSFSYGFRQQIGLSMARRAVSIKHTDWAHEQEVRLLGPQGRTPLPILREVLTGVHFRSVNALVSPIGSLLVNRHPDVRYTQWTFNHGELQTRGEAKELKLIPLDHDGRAIAPTGLSDPSKR